jgi:hypothetical protein
MAEMNKRTKRRQRHAGQNRTGSSSNPRDFATAGEERDRIPGKDPSRDPKTLNDFDPAYGKTYASESQPVGGQAPYERQTYGNQGSSDNPEPTPAGQAGDGAGVSGFGRQYGQGFGVGPGRGVESSAEGLEGSARERDYRGNAGTTFGAVVGPDALKKDESQDKRDDPKPT